MFEISHLLTVLIFLSNVLVTGLIVTNFQVENMAYFVLFFDLCMTA
jgi:hypothetical protein